jgi:hypothetical protein
MINTSLEITENEYLIKFNRSKFDVSFIRDLLKIAELSKPSENYTIKDREVATDISRINADYYSHLDDK